MKKLSGSWEAVSFMSRRRFQAFEATYAHVLLALDHSCQLRLTMLESYEHVIDWEDLVIVAIDQEHFGAWLLESAIIQQREFTSFFDERFKVGIPKFVCECACQVERIFESVNMFEPFPVKHLESRLVSQYPAADGQLT